MMGTEIFEIYASWAETLRKTKVSFLMTPTVIIKSFCFMLFLRIFANFTILKRGQILRSRSAAGVRRHWSVGPAAWSGLCVYQDEVIMAF